MRRSIFSQVFRISAALRSTPPGVCIYKQDHRGRASQLNKTK